MTDEEILEAATAIRLRRFLEQEEKDRKEKEEERARILAEPPPEPIRLPWVVCANCYKPFQLTKYGPVETVFLTTDYENCCVAAITCPHCNIEWSID